MKICCECKLELPFDEFYCENGKPKGRCKNCRKISNKVNFDKWSKTENGKLRIMENGKKYEQKIKEKNKIIREERKRQKELLLKEKQLKEKEERGIKRKEQLEVWRLEREKKEKIKQDEINKKKEYYNSVEYFELKREKEYNRWKKRWENNELFAMKVRIRNLVRNTFRARGHTKPEKKTMEIIGCDYEKLKHHLESQFKEGMDWNNRGEWHIDHIIPLSSAQTKDDLIKLSHYTNLQPLWAEDNLSKSNKIL